MNVLNKLKPGRNGKLYQRALLLNFKYAQLEIKRISC